jgi:DNA-directed RNA polymerase specialized sigma24 family protein
MRKGWEMTQEAFDRLLSWLHKDRETAGIRYEEIRSGLIKVFKYRGCSEPELLTDETINRVSEKGADFIDNYEGRPEAYFFAVANIVYLESVTLRKEINHDDFSRFAANGNDETKETYLECLDSCLNKLNNDDRRIVVNYYCYQKQAKIKNRQALAQEFEIKINTLRIRAYRLRKSLKQCVQRCLKRKEEI